MKKSKTMKTPLQPVKNKISSTTLKPKNKELSDATPKLKKKKMKTNDIGSISASRISGEPSVLGGMSGVTI